MINRELRQGELTLKDMSVLRETEFAKTQYQKNVGHIKEYSLNHVVSLHWGDTFAEGIRDFRPFELRIDNKKFIISWAELKEMDSAGFFRREEPNPSHYRLQYLNGQKLLIDTDLNEEAERDYIFRLSGDGFECYLDWQECLKSGRFI